MIQKTTIYVEVQLTLDMLASTVLHQTDVENDVSPHFDRLLQNL